MSYSKQEKKKGLITGIVIVVILAVALSMCDSDDNSSSLTVSTPEKNYTKQEALAHSQVHVQKLLTSPGSAKFSYPADENIDQLDDSTFRVLAYVDSQNDFGALKRTYYKCTIILHADGTSDCKDLKLEQQN